MKSSVKDYVRFVLIFITFLVGVYALYGGAMLIFDRTGATLKLDIHLGKITFVKDYFILGILLIVLIGVTHLISTALLFIDHNLSAIILLVTGAMLLIWVGVQLVFIGWFFHSSVFFVVSFVEIVLSIIIIIINKRENKRE